MVDIAPRLNIGDPAPPITLEDIHGQPVSPSQYWVNGPTLMTFLRHFG